MKKNDSNKNKQRDPIPDSFPSIEAAAEFWDTHSLADYEDILVDVTDDHFDLVRTHFRVDSKLARKIGRIAKKRGISSETLVNLWLQEKAA